MARNWIEWMNECCYLMWARRWIQSWRLTGIVTFPKCRRVRDGDTRLGRGPGWLLADPLLRARNACNTSGSRSTSSNRRLWRWWLWLLWLRLRLLTRILNSSSCSATVILICRAWPSWLNQSKQLINRSILFLVTYCHFISHSINIIYTDFALNNYQGDRKISYSKSNFSLISSFFLTLYFYFILVITSILKFSKLF